MRAKNAGPEPVEVDSVLQFFILDRLPADLLKIVWDAPIDLDLRQVQGMLNRQRRNPNARAAEKLVNAIYEDFPAWHRERV